jgi:hypothetical protein
MATRSLVSEPVHGVYGYQHASPLWSYQVEVAAELLDEESNLIEWLIDFAFGTLGARHLDVRVWPYEL